MALTKAQRRILEALERESPQSRASLSARRDVLEQMADRRLIVTAGPFSYAYHTVSISPAGRAALAESKGGEDGK